MHNIDVEKCLNLVFEVVLAKKGQKYMFFAFNSQDITLRYAKLYIFLKI